MSYGVWSLTEDGFVSDPGDLGDAAVVLRHLLAEGGNDGDLVVTRACDFHPGRPHHSCEECVSSPAGSW